MGVCCTDKAMVTMVRIIACKVCQQSTHANDGMRIVCSIQHVCRLFDVENHIIFCMCTSFTKPKHLVFCASARFICTKTDYLMNFFLHVDLTHPTLTLLWFTQSLNRLMRKTVKYCNAWQKERERARYLCHVLFSSLLQQCRNGRAYVNSVGN